MPKLTKEKARERILKEANKASVRKLTAKHLQHAVFICRQNELVTPLTLERAGFNAKRRK